MKYSILLAYLFCCSTATFSQITATTFLATAKTKNTVLRQQDKVTTLKSMPYSLPFLEKINFQTQTDRFKLERQEYQTRASFNGWEEMKKEKLWKKATINVAKSEQEVLFQDILLDRYAALIEYRYAVNALQLYRRIYAVFADKRDVLQKMAKLSTDFNIEDLIKAEDNAFQFQQKITDKELTIKQIEQLSQFITQSKDTFQLDTSTWIPLSKIRDLVANLPLNASKNALLTRQEAKINLAQAAYDVEKASTRKIVDFAQLKYGARPTNQLTTEFSVGLGFVVPYRGSSKITLNKLAIKQLEERNQLKDIQESIDLQLFTQQKELEATFKAYDLATQQVAESRTLYSLDHYMHLQGSSPITLLRMQELVLLRQSRLIDLEHEALIKYIKLLSATGKLSAMPLQNYLSANLEGF